MKYRFKTFRNIESLCLFFNDHIEDYDFKSAVSAPAGVYAIYTDKSL